MGEHLKASRWCSAKEVGTSYGQTKAYWQKLKAQAAGGTTFLKKREIKHQVLRYNLVDFVPHTQVAGLQLADIIASAFYQAVNSNEPQWEIRHALRLQKVMAKERNVIADYGLVIHPTNPKQFTPDKKQKQIFHFYGYKF